MPTDITYDDAYLQSLEAIDQPDTAAEFDPDAEYNRPAPPIHDGWYLMTFANAGVYNEGNKVPFRSAQWKNESRPHFEIAVVGVIAKPEDSLVDGKHVYTDMPLTTTPDPERNNASAVSAAFRALTGKPIAGLPGLGHVKQLDEVLRSGNVTGWGRVQNVLRDRDAEKAAGLAGEKRPKAVYGQKKISALPGGTDSAGKFTGAADHPETGVRCVSKAVLVEFKPASWTPGSK